MAENNRPKARRNALLRAAGMLPPPHTPPKGARRRDDDASCILDYRASRNPVCFEDHATSTRDADHDARICAYLQERWTVFGAESIIEEVGSRVVTAVARDLRHLPPDRFRSPSGFFVAECRRVAKLPRHVVDQLIQDL